jgi:CubicO group peptidase (beta-lactamase class C family)
MRFFEWARVCVSVGLVCGGLAIGRADEVDDVVAEQMREKQIPGLSLAIVSDGRIVRAGGYGVVEKDTTAPVTDETLFQAGSISKPVAAVGVLRLVERQLIDLDGDVNEKLRTWKVPENEFTAHEKVTVRRLLCHGAGLTVHGFPGYGMKGPIPTLVQVLDGTAPANTEAIRVDLVPGSKCRYSGGGYTVLQQLVLDVTGSEFPAFMERTVLEPIGMVNSTYAQPLPRGKARRAAVGHLQDGTAIEGRWHVYPEMAAAGLWTTASDLARFAIAVQEALAGKPHSVLSQATAREMVTRQIGDFGLGVALIGTDEDTHGEQIRLEKKPALIFCHSGRDAGFDANLAATATTGKGAVVLINKNDDNGAIEAIMKAIAKKYEWP